MIGKRFFLHLSIIWMFVLSGCGSRTVLTTVTYFPQSAKWSTASNSLVIRAEGELGKAYSGFSSKRVTLILFEKEKEINNLQCIFNAGDLEWKVVWTNIENLRVDFYADTGRSNAILKTLELTVKSSQ